MSFTFVDAIGLISVYVFVHWQTTTSTAGSSRDREWYKRGADAIRSKGGCAPPGWLFGVAWWLLYKLITAALFIAFREFPDTTWTYLAIFITASVNILLNKAWSMLFWDFGRTGWSLIVAFLMLDSAIVVLVFVAITTEATLRWLVFGLYIPYALWLMVAIYLNWWWWRQGLSTQIEARVKVSISNQVSRTRKNNINSRKQRHTNLVPLSRHHE